MKTDNIERYLESFGKQVVNRAKGNLQKSKGGNTNLENSIKFEVVEDEDGFAVQFYMNSYGSFVDKGVSGTNKNRSFKNYQGKVIKSPYKYTNKQPPPSILAKWISKKGIKGRDKKSGSFFQKPLMLGMKQFGKQLLGAVKEDIIEGLSTIK